MNTNGAICALDKARGFALIFDVDCLVHDHLWISLSFCIGALPSACACGNSTTFRQCLDGTCACAQLEKDEQSGKTSLLKALWGLDILKDSWSPSLSVFKCLESIRALMADPNPDDAMRQWIAAPWLKTSHQCIWQIWPEQLDSITLSDFDVIQSAISRFLTQWSHCDWVGPGTHLGA